MYDTINDDHFFVIPVLDKFRIQKFIIMNSIRNQVQLLGNLGKDVEISKFDSGSVKASFTLATNEYYKDNKGEKVESTQWHNVVAWGKSAELMKSILSKGSKVLVKGKLVSRSYDTKEGEKKYITEVVANEFECMDTKEMPF